MHREQNFLIVNTTETAFCRPFLDFNGNSLASAVSLAHLDDVADGFTSMAQQVRIAGHFGWHAVAIVMEKDFAVMALL
jgi:hypothetical protein